MKAKVLLKAILPGFVFVRCFGVLVVVTFRPVLLAQGGSESAYDIVQRDTYLRAFQNGDTNTPLLVMDWFSHSHCDEFCRVSRSGRVSSARYVVNWAVQGGHWADLNQMNLESLVATMNTLPPPPKAAPPKERWLVVQGIRSNQWFKYIYDRANIPDEVERLYTMTGASLVWFIPEVKGVQVARIDSGKVACVAREAPIAVIVGNNLLRVLDMRASPHNLTPTLKTTPYLFQPVPWEPVVISPNGKIIVLATPYEVQAIDWEADTLLWKSEALDHNHYSGKTLAIGDEGKTLFAAGANLLDRRDLVTGKKLGSLGNSGLYVVKHFETSLDGSVLLVGFGSHNSLPTLVSLWESGKDEVAFPFFSTTPGAHVGISPDGKTLIVNRWSERKLEVWDWRTERKEEFPLRVPYGASSVSSFCWSPDGRRLAAQVSTTPPASVIYETTTWKPLAQWAGSGGLAFYRNGSIFRFSGAEISVLDVTKF